MIKQMRSLLIIAIAILLTNAAYTMEFRNRFQHVDHSDETDEKMNIESLFASIPNAQPWHNTAYAELDQTILNIRSHLHDIESPAPSEEVIKLLAGKIAELDTILRDVVAIYKHLKHINNEAYHVRRVTDEIEALCCIGYLYKGALSCLSALRSCYDTANAYYYYSYAYRQLSALLNELRSQDSFGNIERTLIREYHAYPVEYHNIEALGL